MPASRQLSLPAGRTAGPRLGWGRRAAHALAIVAGWLLFFWGWHRVLARGADFGELRLLVLGAAIVVPVVTVSWILHNRGIHRRKGPRRQVAVATLDYRVDFHGRTIEGDFSALVGARRVDIVVDGLRKRYVEGRLDDAQAVLAHTELPGATSDLAARARSAIDHASATQAST